MKIEHESGTIGRLRFLGREFRVEKADLNSFQEALNHAGKNGYKLITPAISTNFTINTFIQFEKAIRVDSQVVEARVLARVEAVKAELEGRIIKVSEEKAQAASDQLRVQLIDAIKDASLFEDKYKNAVIDAALSKFREELNKAIQDLKNK